MLQVCTLQLHTGEAGAAGTTGCGRSTPDGVADPGMDGSIGRSARWQALTDYSEGAARLLLHVVSQRVLVCRYPAWQPHPGRPPEPATNGSSRCSPRWGSGLCCAMRVEQAEQRDWMPGSGMAGVRSPAGSAARIGIARALLHDARSGCWTSPPKGSIPRPRREIVDLLLTLGRIAPAAHLPPPAGAGTDGQGSP